MKSFKDTKTTFFSFLGLSCVLLSHVSTASAGVYYLTPWTPCNSTNQCSTRFPGSSNYSQPYINHFSESFYTVYEYDCGYCCSPAVPFIGTINVEDIADPESDYRTPYSNCVTNYPNYYWRTDTKIVNNFYGTLRIRNHYGVGKQLPTIKGEKPSLIH